MKSKRIRDVLTATTPALSDLLPIGASTVWLVPGVQVAAITQSGHSEV